MTKQSISASSFGVHEVISEMIVFGVDVNTIDVINVILCLGSKT